MLADAIAERKMQRKFAGSLLVVLFLAPFALGDVYLHMPRGSNNRLNEANRDRNNGNRMFDSQNNNRGGANVGTCEHRNRQSRSLTLWQTLALTTTLEALSTSSGALSAFC